jgi:hypothetical protein
MNELEVMQEVILKQKQYIKELKDIIETYESLVREHLVRKPAEMGDNEDLWKKYLSGELNGD